MAIKARYNKKGWVLGQCVKCYRFNYVEPHGIDTECKCSDEWTDHNNISHKHGDQSIRLPDQRKKHYLLD